MQTSRRHEQSDGFTLVEILVVVAIIGVLAAVSVPGLLRARLSGNEASAGAANEDIVPAAKTCNGAAAASRAMYHVAADPVNRGQTGTRSFGSDQRGTVYYRYTASIQSPIPAALTTSVR